MFSLRPRKGKIVLLCTLLTLAGFSLGQAQVLDFDVTSEGPRSDIDRTTLTVPMMPEGLEEGMSLKDMAELIALLSQKRQGRQP